MNAELIRFARKHRYNIAEGFCDPKPGSTFEKMVETAVDESPPALQKFLDADAAELSEAAGIPFDEAKSAMICWIFKKYLDRQESQRKN